MDSEKLAWEERRTLDPANQKEAAIEHAEAARIHRQRQEEAAAAGDRDAVRLNETLAYIHTGLANAFGEDPKPAVRRPLAKSNK